MAGGRREVQGHPFQWPSFNHFIQMHMVVCYSPSLGLLSIEWLSAPPPTLRLRLPNCGGGDRRKEKRRGGEGRGKEKGKEDV